MNNKHSNDFTQIATQLAVRETAITKRQNASVQSAFAALTKWQREKAREWFEVSLAWNELQQFVNDWKELLNETAPLTYVVDVWFLQDLLVQLTPGRDEEVTYVTGISLGKLKILSRMCPVTLEKQSVVYARAKARSCAEVLTGILEKGNNLHVMAHSHPGRGAAATHESSIDVHYLSRIQRAGADVVGIIVTRDGFVRFFTVEKPFQVSVQGNGVIQVEENVFQVTLPEKNQN